MHYAAQGKDAGQELCCMQKQPSNDANICQIQNMQFIEQFLIHKLQTNNFALGSEGNTQAWRRLHTCTERCNMTSQLMQFALSDAGDFSSFGLWW